MTLYYFYLGGRSNTSFENIREERFWELLGNGNNNNSDKKSNGSSPLQLEVLSYNDHLVLLIIHNVIGETSGVEVT